MVNWLDTSAVAAQVNARFEHTSIVTDARWLILGVHACRGKVSDEEIEGLFQQDRDSSNDCMGI